MAAPELIRTGDGAYRLEGEATLYTVGSLTTLPEPHDNRVSIDLGHLEKVDSGALALLLRWYRWAARHDIHLTIVSPPEDLLALMRLYDLNQVLDDAMAKPIPAEQ